MQFWVQQGRTTPGLCLSEKLPEDVMLLVQGPHCVKQEEGCVQFVCTGV